MMFTTELLDNIARYTAAAVLHQVILYKIIDIDA